MKLDLTLRFGSSRSAFSLTPSSVLLRRTLERRERSIIKAARTLSRRHPSVSRCFPRELHSFIILGNTHSVSSDGSLIADAFVKCMTVLNLCHSFALILMFKLKITFCTHWDIFIGLEKCVCECVCLCECLCL